MYLVGIYKFYPAGTVCMILIECFVNDKQSFSMEQLHEINILLFLDEIIKTFIFMIF